MSTRWPEALAQGAILSPFTRIARLLEGIPGHEKVIELTIGDPKERMPDFVIDRMVEAKQLLGTYPKIRGSDELRQAIASWIERRYGLAGRIDAAREVIPINGSREGLFYAMLPAVGRKRVQGRPVVLCPIRSITPISGGMQPIASRISQRDRGHWAGQTRRVGTRNGHPERTVAFYLCSLPIRRCSSEYLIHDEGAGAGSPLRFMLFFDECYSEIYTVSTDRRTEVAPNPEVPQSRRLQLSVKAIQPARITLRLRGW